MKLEKSETNNAIITTLTNVRKHSNADRLMLATVLGTQVIVDTNSKDGDVVVYFDSNLQLSYDYLHNNNLFSNPEMNKDTTKKGYFGKNGRVKVQKLRGEISNGYVAPISSLDFIKDLMFDDVTKFKVGNEFTHINGTEICRKYVIPITYAGGGNRTRKSRGPISEMFKQHWDTKQLARGIESIPPDAMIYIEEKIHGSSGRSQYALCNTYRPWWQFWKPKQEWKVISGTRRIDDIDFHIPNVRKEIEEKVAPFLHKGEEIFYEIYGYDKTGKPIQSGFPYGCKPTEYKSMLYRVTITTPDGFCVDMDRDFVYRRADELGLEKPTLLFKGQEKDVQAKAKELAQGQSALDLNTLREGVVVWFKSYYGSWTALKYKSEAFLIKESEIKDKEIGDVEDNL